jgi:SAM-dependent methyltransferase
MNDAYLHPYRDSVADKGTGFTATLWASPNSQRLRFEVFQQMCPMQGKSILDVGCSRGDLAAWLIEQGVRYDRFIGVDGVPEVVAYAQQRGLPAATFHLGDAVADPSVMTRHPAQVVCISGTLNTMNHRQISRVLEGAWAAAEETLMFNFLSERHGAGAPRQEPPVVRLDPLKWLDWALKKTSAVALRQDYFRQGHDATIMMRREPQS